MLKLRIGRCPSCDGVHQAVDCSEYAVARPSRTHWYVCPATGDPVQLLVQIEDGRVHDVPPEVVESLLTARRAGRYVIAAFWIEDLGDGKQVTHCVQHPHEFPTDSFGLCVQLLKDAFEKIAGPPPKTAPMRRATPSVNLWALGVDEQAAPAMDDDEDDDDEREEEDDQ